MRLHRLLGPCCLLVLILSAQVRASEDDGTFSNAQMYTDQFRSMWDGGSQVRVEAVWCAQTSWNYSTHWDGTFNICVPSIPMPWPIPDIPGFCFGKTGFEFSLDTNGIVGGGGFAYATAGDVSCTHYATDNLSFPQPDTVAPNTNFTFTNANALTPGQFSNMRISSPNAGLGLLARLRAHLYINLSAYVFGATIFNETIFNFTIDSADMNPNPQTILGMIGPIRVRRDDLGYIKHNDQDYKMMEIVSTDWPIIRILIILAIKKDPSALLPKAIPDHVTNIITIQILDPTYIKLFKPTESGGVITYDTYPYTYPPPGPIPPSFTLPPADPLFKPFVVVRASLTNAIVVLLGLPFGWNRDYNIGGIQFTFRLFDIYTKIEFGFEQHFVHKPKLRATLDFFKPDDSSAVPSIGVVAGSSTSMQIPTGVDYVRVNPSLSVNGAANDFDNRTDLKFTFTEGFALLRFTFGHPDIGVIDFPNDLGVNLDWFLYQPVPIQVYGNSFNLGGYTSFPNLINFKIYPALPPVITPPDITTLAQDTAILNVVSHSRTLGVATLTTDADHNLLIGQSVTVAGLTNSSFNGAVVVTGTPTKLQFTYANAGSDVASTPDTAGTVTVAINMPVAAIVAANSSGQAPIPNVITASPQPFPLSPLSDLTVVDNYVSPPQISKTQDVPSGTLRAMSSTALYSLWPIVITCKDLRLNTSSVTTYLKIVDLSAPVFTHVPLPRIVHHDTGKPTNTPVIITLPTAVDNVDANPVVQVVGFESYPVTTAGDGSKYVTIDYPIGTTALIFSTRDRSGNTRLVASTVTVLNTAPTLDLGGPYVVDEGSSVDVLGTAADPAAPGETGTEGDDSTFLFGWDLDKNGTFESAGAGATYNAIDGPSINTLRCRVVEGMFRGNTVFKNVNVTVNNVAPTITGPISGPAGPKKTGVPVYFTVPFTDPGILDTHTVVWTWGDGTTSPGVVSETLGQAGGSFGTAYGTHTYTAAGVYTVSVVVTDKDGGSDSAIFEFVFVFDVVGGSISGKGKFQVPAGSLAANLGLTGPATFTLSGFYKPGLDLPTAKATLAFTAGAFKFASTSCNYLGVSGTKAYLRGSGTVNGVTGFDFLCTLKDDPVGGDRIRFKIWNHTTTSVVFDTQPGGPDDATATVGMISGGVKVIPP